MYKKHHLLTLLLLVVLCTPTVLGRCYRWCEHPTGGVYCCQRQAPRPNDNPSAVHPGTCITDLKGCIPGEPVFGRWCSHDGSCQPHEKCCYDFCARRHKCKRAF